MPRATAIWQPNPVGKVSLFLPKDVRLTKKQEELRIQGLRILARMMVRAYLKDLADANRGVSQNGVSAESQREAEQDVG